MPGFAEYFMVKIWDINFCRILLTKKENKVGFGFYEDEIQEIEIL